MIHSDLFRLILVECQELLYVVQKTWVALDRGAHPTFRHSNALPQEKSKKQENAKAPASDSSSAAANAQTPREFESTRSWQEMGFSSQQELFKFQDFLKGYISYTVEMADMLLGITSLKQVPLNLDVMERRVQKACYSVTMRVHKSITALMKMFPKTSDLSKASLFDKNYLLNCILNAIQFSEQDALQEFLMVPPYIAETD